MGSFRTAKESEDERVARIIYHAFRFAWEANWWSDISTPLRELDSQEASVPAATVDGGKPLNRKERTRLDLYRASVALTRLIGGSVDVATDNEDRAVAICLWFPPNARPGYWDWYRSGIISAVLGFGFVGLYNLMWFKDMTKSLYTFLPQLGFKHEDCGYVWFLCTDPKHAGHGYAGKLLDWEVRRHREHCPKVPVLLETSTGYAVKVYERVGFRVLAHKEIRLNVDKDGMRTESKLSEAEQNERAKGHTVRAMICEE